MKDVNWPNFFIVGAARSGTTSLYTYLSQHPQIYMSPVKEPHFFSRVQPDRMQMLLMNPITNQEEYLALFRGVDQQHKAIGEASTSYLWDTQAPDRIKATVPDARIIVVLRHPVERAFSHYLLDVREGVQTNPFFEALVADYSSHQKSWGNSHLYVELGLYYKQVKRYVHRFTSEQVLVLLFEELTTNTRLSLVRVLDFLEVDATLIGDIEHETKHNVYAQPRTGLARSLLGTSELRAASHKLLPKRFRRVLHDKMLLRQAEKPQMDPRAVQFLREIYEPDIACLEKLLGIRLCWDMDFQNSTVVEHTLLRDGLHKSYE